MKFMILAAGLGTRMRPLTDNTPKPLIKVNNRHMLERALDSVKAAGLTEGVVNYHYLGDQIVDYIRGRNDIAVTLSDETEELLETGGGLMKALPLLDQDQPLFIANGDVIWLDGKYNPISALMEAWDDEAMDVLLLTVPREEAFGYEGLGDFHQDAEGRLHPRGEAASAPEVFTGLRIVHPRVLEGFPVAPFSMVKVFDRAREQGRLYGLRHDGAWLHVGTPEDRDAAEKRLQELENA